MGSAKTLYASLKRRRRACHTAFLLAAGLFCQAAPALAQADTKPPAPAPSLNSLSMEVSALQALYQFQFTKPQLERLQKLAVGTAAKDQKRKVGKASKEFRAKLQALRKALSDAKDEALIRKLDDELDAMREKEKPALDDGVDITDSARGRAAEAFRMLRPSQLALYVAHIAEDVLDPAQQLMEAFEEVRDLTDEEWKEERAEIVEDISRLAVGLDAGKAKPMSDQIDALLQRVRKLSKTDFQKQRAELNKAARKIVGESSALDVLRRQIEVDLAVLLSNPRLPETLRVRLGTDKK
jgi:hypothetical protein